MRADLQRECAWCGKDMGDKESPMEGKTHGICDRCRALVIKDELGNDQPSVDRAGSLKKARRLFVRERTAITLQQIEHYQEPSSQFAIVTGWRPDPSGSDPEADPTPDTNSRKQNKLRNREITMWLEQQGYKWEDVIGGYDSEEHDTFIHERSLFIPEIEWEEVLGIAREYGQESFIYKPRNGPVGMYASDGSWASVFPAWIKGADPLQDINEPEEGQEQQFHTRFRRRGPFVEFLYDDYAVAIEPTGKPALWEDLGRTNPEVVYAFAEANPQYAQEVYTLAGVHPEPGAEEVEWAREEMGLPALQTAVRSLRRARQRLARSVSRGTARRRPEGLGC